MMNLIKAKERFFPARKHFRLFEDVGCPHDVTLRIYAYPFRHIVIDNFLPQVQYDSLVTNIRKVLARGLSEVEDRERYSRFDLYDLYAYMPAPTLDLPYGCFFSGTYFQMLENALQRVVSRDTFMTFHHHTPNPKDNYIHNDYVYEYFADEPLRNGVNPWFYQCEKFRPSGNSRPVIRAATSIFYLDNDWNEGQGGETGIFATKEKDSFVRKIPPVNNRLLVFDITPTSFHNYMSCAMPARNSLAQWYYVSENDALTRFPGVQPGGWENLYKKRFSDVPSAKSGIQ